MLTFNIIYHIPNTFGEDEKLQETNRSPIDTVIDILNQAWVQAILAVVAIIASIFAYILEQNRIRKENIINSYKALIREIEENRDALTSSRFSKIQYNSSEAESPSSDVYYTNAFLDTDVYESVLNSGNFIFFSANAQHTLTMLYGRIRGHNTIVSYLDHLEDLYKFQNKNLHSEPESFFSIVRRYDILVTKMEKEIIKIMDEALTFIRDETPKVRLAYKSKLLENNIKFFKSL